MNVSLSLPKRTLNDAARIAKFECSFDSHRGAGAGEVWVSSVSIMACNWSRQCGKHLIPTARWWWNWHADARHVDALARWVCVSVCRWSSPFAAKRWWRWDIQAKGIVSFVVVCVALPLVHSFFGSSQCYWLVVFAVSRTKRFTIFPFDVHDDAPIYDKQTNAETKRNNDRRQPKKVEREREREKCINRRGAGDVPSVVMR